MSFESMMGRMDFQIWLEKMGYNRKQVREAAATIGMTGATLASQTSSGVRELTMTERLAMAAVRAGLQPWTPETDADAAGTAALREMVRNFSRTEQASSSTEAESTAA